VTWTNR